MPPRFLLFKASAGSGKTYNLAMQYIALLVARGPHEFRHTLAVTFTNKATAEMKDRILLFLRNFWRGEGKAEDFGALKRLLHDDYHLTPTDEELRERCHQALHAILHDYGRFCVSTIDAFFQTVLRSMAHELGLSARLQVDLDDKDVVELAVENLIENLRHGDREVLPWLQQYIEQQLDEGRSWDVRRELKQMARMLFQEEYLKRSLDETHNKPFDIQNIRHFSQALKAERKRALQPVLHAAGGFEQLMQSAGMDYDRLNYGGDVQRYVEKMKEGDMEANFGKRLDDMTTESLKLLKSALRKDTSLHGTAQTLADGLRTLHDLHQKARHCVDSIDLALANLTPMGLLGAIDKEVTRISDERNRFMLARTPIMLRRMVQGDDASFVFERIGTQYNNIMIDEFQDTSRMQWENFRTLLLDNLASGGLSMVVGDIKQSIYRWRNGDWRILHGLDREGYNGTPLTQRPLRQNFRSGGNIVTFNNRLFPTLGRVLDTLGTAEGIRIADLYEKTEVKQDIEPKKEGEGYVRIQLFQTDDKQMEAEWPETMLADLCRQVNELHSQGMPYSEMTILVRKNRYIPPVIACFAAHMPDVKLVSNEAFLLGSSVAVGMMVNALQMVDDIGRNPVAARYVAKHYLRDVMQRDVEENDFLLPPLEDILPEPFIQHLDELRDLPLYELCEAIYRRLNLQAIERQDAYVFCFLDELSAYLRDNPSDIATFLQYWNDTLCTRAIPASEVDGIRIYTIHKSKGLAFHTVLMPFAEWDIERDMTGDLYWCQPGEPPLDEMGTLPVKFSARKIQGTAFEQDYTQEHANRRADELNALYVAFTRAKENLYVWGLSKGEPTKDKQDENVADLLLKGIFNPGECQDRDEPLGGQRTEEEGLHTFTFGTVPHISREGGDGGSGSIRIAMESHEGGLSFRQSQGATDFIRRAGDETEQSDERQLSYIEQGKLLHYIFSKIETAEDIDRVTKQFAQQGILKSEKQLAQVRRLAENGLRHKQVREWYSGRYRLFNERNILVPTPGQPGKLLKRRPDRVMVSDERIIIVDFKFGRPEEEHQQQVSEYMGILQSMYPQHQVEGWLWYVYKNQVERTLPPAPPLQGGE